MNINQVGEMLGLARQTLYNWRLNGTGPRSIKCGHLVRCRPEDVDAWIDSCVKRESA